MNEQALRSLKKFTRAASSSDGRAQPGSQGEKKEHCELCTEPLASAHQHLMDPTTRELICTCDGCVILFDSTGLTKFRRVPRDIRMLADFRLSGEEWEKLLVPIQLAFFYRSSHAGRVVALYPSPAGVTEAVIDQQAWEQMVRANPALEELQEDVQALLVNRLKGKKDYFVCPMDRCFQLVGMIRRNWRGFSGGDQVWNKVDEFLLRLKEEARS